MAYYYNVSYTTKNLKNKAVFNLKQYCMHCYVTLSNVFYLMHAKMYIYCLLIRSLRVASFKVCLCVIVISVTVCTVGYVCLLRRDQIFVDFVSFLSMIIYVVLYSLL